MNIELLYRKNGEGWLLQVSEGIGGTNVVEWKEFKSLYRVKSYIEHNYFVQESDSDE